jgi:DNA polymerase-3 subunit beta
MEFTIKQNVLKEELSYIQGVVERKSTIPVLSNILIESLGEGSIRIVGTDLDVTIRCDAEADIKTGGAMCIQARKLFDIVRTLDGGDVHFKKEDNEWVRMAAGRAKFRLAGVNREQYPEIPIFKSAPLKLSAEVFNYFIQNTAFAITNEQSRFTLSGAKFMIGDGIAKMVTTDGHRLAYIEKSIDDSEAKLDTLVPKKALLELVKISRGQDGEIQFGEDQNHIYFETEGRLLITRKLTGSFPNYEMVMPKDNDKSVTFDLGEMKSAVRRISLMADERQRSIRMTVREGEVELTAASSEEGEGSEVVPAEYTGSTDEITLGFNWQYLQEFLNNVGAIEQSAPPEAAAAVAGAESDTASAPAPSTATRIAFEFKDANAATQMRIDGDSSYDYKYIVMPLRI